jgi:hypothetical protein
MTSRRFSSIHKYLRITHGTGEESVGKEKERILLPNGLLRLHVVPPSLGELYHLRRLLRIPGPDESFEQLREVDGVLCSSFQDSCMRRRIHRNRRESDDTWDDRHYGRSCGLPVTKSIVEVLLEWQTSISNGAQKLWEHTGSETIRAKSGF